MKNKSSKVPQQLIPLRKAEKTRPSTGLRTIIGNLVHTGLPPANFNWDQQIEDARAEQDARTSGI